MIVQNELFSEMNYHSGLSFGVFSKTIVHIDCAFQDEILFQQQKVHYHMIVHVIVHLEMNYHTELLFL